jgi:hypothetical protein
MRVKILLAALLTVMPAVTSAAETKVGGNYSVRGTNFDGSSYTGRAHIVMSSDQVCQITWWVGPATYEGICLRNESSLAVGYQLGSSFGLVIYRIQKDGVLLGVWTTPGSQRSGTDVLTPR